MPGPMAGHGRSSSWQDRLGDHLKSMQMHPPVFNIVSDRRGGRTAWSSTVTVPSPGSGQMQTVQARYWYDGQFVNNAKEDAAEVALRLLTGTGATPASPTGSTSTTGSGYGSAGGQQGGGPSGSGSGGASGGGNSGAVWPRAQGQGGPW